MMSTPDSSNQDSKIINTTQIGSVIGQVHTGSGDILISNSQFDLGITSRADLLTSLKQLRTELQVAQEQGVPNNAIEQAVAEIDDAEKEASQDEPNRDNLLSRLQHAKSVMLAAVSTVAAIGSAVNAVEKIVPSIEKIMQAVSKLF
jgi:hypothetical protein